MKSLKSITAGISFIIIAILLMQLAYLIIIVGFNNLAKDYPTLNNINGTVGYLITTSVLIFIMFLGGYITALLAEKKKLLHCSIVGLITTGVMMWMALENSKLTSNGILINGLMLVSTIIGGYYQNKNSSNQ